MSDNGSTTESEVDQPEPEQRVGNIGNLGLNIFLGSITMVFAACILGYVFVWARAPQWPPAGAPGFPNGLWISTALVIVISIVLLAATSAAKAGKKGLLTIILGITLLLALAFLANQVSNWREMVPAWDINHFDRGDRDPVTGRFPITPRLYAFVFYLLTGVHAVHLIGGLVPLVFVLFRATKGVYGPENFQGVRFCARYWHYLDAMWCLLFIVLLATF